MVENTSSCFIDLATIIGAYLNSISSKNGENMQRVKNVYIGEIACKGLPIMFRKTLTKIDQTNSMPAHATMFSTLLFWEIA